MQQATLAKLAITSAVAVAGVGFLVYSSVAGAAHYKMVDELVVARADHGDVVLDQRRWRTRRLAVRGSRRCLARERDERHRGPLARFGRHEPDALELPPERDPFVDRCLERLVGHDRELDEL